MSSHDIDAVEGYIGVDVDLESEIAGEIGWDFFKKISRTVKKGVKSVGKVAKAVVRSPLVKAGAAGLALVVPAVGVPLTGALVAADKLISMAESADKARAQVAKTFILNTKAAAKTDPEAARGFKVLQTVYKRKKEVKQMSPAQRQELLRNQILSAKRKRAALELAARPSINGFLVRPGGRIERGNFIRKG